MIDLMLADSPRVEFGKERITQDDIKEARVKDKELQERLKKGKGIGANLKNRISNNSAFLQNKMNKNRET